jgi:hypothetical protein
LCAVASLICDQLIPVEGRISMRKTWVTSLLALMAATALAGAITAASAQGMGGHHLGGGGGGGHAGPHGGGYAGPHGDRLGGGHGPAMSGGARHFGSYSHGPSLGGGAPHAQRSFVPQHTMRSEFGARGHGIQTGGMHERGLSSQRGMHERNLRGQNLAHERNTRGQNLRTTTRTGAHGFAQAGAHSRIPLSHTKINQIRQVALHHDLFSRFRVSHVNFDIAIGVHVPRHFRLFLVPEEIVVIEPAFFGFRCFFFEDEFVIVDPVTFVIVAVIPV